MDPTAKFHSEAYLRSTNSRLAHLASLGLDLDGKRVFEVGAGIGDHTGFFLERGCTVVTSEPRPENLAILRERHGRHARVQVRCVDLDHPAGPRGEHFEIVHCYGTLYHLSRPAEALAFLAERCTELLLLATCVSPGQEEALNPVAENAQALTQAVSGRGCRPTRPWIVRELRRHFEHVYLPATQPDHPEYPLDWSVPPATALTRAVFIASRTRLDNALLLDHIPMQQQRACPETP